MILWQKTEEAGKGSLGSKGTEELGQGTTQEAGTPLSGSILLVPFSFTKDLLVSCYLSSILLFIYPLGFSYKRSQGTFELVSEVFHITSWSPGVFIFLQMIPFYSSLQQSSIPWSVNITRSQDLAGMNCAATNVDVPGSPS